MVMKVRGVDPRSTCWEINHPAYRVNFWAGGPESGWASDEREIEDADVDEVLSWARNNAEGRRFVLYARVGGQHPGDEPGLVRLLGTDPSAELPDCAG
jgi:hypothetical protein